MPICKEQAKLLSLNTAGWSLSTHSSSLLPSSPVHRWPCLFGCSPGHDPKLRYWDISLFRSLAASLIHSVLTYVTSTQRKGPGGPNHLGLSYVLQTARQHRGGIWNNFPLVFTAFAYVHVRKVAIPGIETGLLPPEHISMFLQDSFYCSMYPTHRASSEVTKHV